MMMMMVAMMLIITAMMEIVKISCRILSKQTNYQSSYLLTPEPHPLGPGLDPQCWYKLYLADSSRDTEPMECGREERETKTF